MKTLTCPRCKGKRIFNAHVVVHCGVPGLCFECDGSGQIARLSTEERVVLLKVACRRDMDQLCEEAGRVKTALESCRFGRRSLEHQLEQLRRAYREAAALLRSVSESGKLPNRADRPRHWIPRDHSLTRAARLQKTLNRESCNA